MQVITFLGGTVFGVALTLGILFAVAKRIIDSIHTDINRDKK